MPKIWTEEQVGSWKPVVKAVHDKGGIFFCQLWHYGRQSGYKYQSNEIQPVSSTSKPMTRSKLLAPDYLFVDFLTPRQLQISELPSIVNDYVVVAKNSIDIVFDGMKIHGENGYLIDQFLKDGINDRTDEYGGLIENKARFPLQVVDAIVAAIRDEQVGIRLLLAIDFGNATNSNPTTLGTYMAKELSKQNIAYVHNIEARMKSGGIDDPEESLWPFRKCFTGGAFLAVGGYKWEDGIKAVKSGKAEVVVYGRHFIANPYLPKRFQLNASLSKYDQDTSYIPDLVVGYTDYPFLEEPNLEYAKSL